jgi:hypothetical protein
VAWVCVEETGFRWETEHCLRFEKPAGCDDAERPEVHSRAEPGNDEKGLERPAVIVTDLRLVSDLYEKRMHIAVSRALILLRIVGVEGEVRKDHRLAEFI